MQAVRIERGEANYTLRDYLTWDDSERWELIDGKAYSMALAPTVTHQELSIRISGELYYYLKGKTCKVFHSPIDVVFAAADDAKTVVQPDIIVVCDPNKLSGDKRVTGAPDIVVEILSPSSVAHDFHRKMRLYEREGVPEYWIASPENKQIYQFVLKDGRYEEIITKDETLRTELLPDFTLDIKEIFAE